MTNNVNSEPATGTAQVTVHSYVAILDGEDRLRGCNNFMVSHWDRLLGPQVARSTNSPVKTGETFAQQQACSADGAHSHQRETEA